LDIRGREVGVRSGGQYQGGLAVTWLYPVLAVVFGVAASFLVLFANGAAITQQAAATALIAGVLAGATAVGVTEAGRKADAVKDARKGDG
jgi:uncharacterized membrane-anchored protein YhcB (DUF1043 family)